MVWEYKPLAKQWGLIWARVAELTFQMHAERVDGYNPLAVADALPVQKYTC